RNLGAPPHRRRRPPCRRGGSRLRREHFGYSQFVPDPDPHTPFVFDVQDVFLHKTPIWSQDFSDVHQHVNSSKWSGSYPVPHTRVARVGILHEPSEHWSSAPLSQT